MVNRYSTLALPLALFLILATSGCVNTSTTSTTTTTTTSTTSTTTTTTWSSTTTSSSSPVEINFTQATSFQMTAGSLIPVSLAVYNYMPVNLSQNAMFVEVENIFCPKAIPTGTDYMSNLYRFPSDSTNQESIANILAINSNVTKAAYQEFSITNPGVLSGVAFKINTSYLGTTKLTIPIYFAAPVAALYEYSVCTAVNDAEYQNIARNCQIGYVTETGHTPSDVTPSVKVESQYGDYKIYITFSKGNNVGQVGYSIGQVDAIVYKVYMNQKDITSCCHPEYSLSKTFDINGFQLDFADPYIDNSGPFKERIVCELTPKNDQLYCDNTAIPGTDTKYGTMAFLDIVVGYPYKKNFVNLDVNVIITSTNTLQSCPTDDKAVIKTYNYVPVLDNPYAMAAMEAVKNINLAYGVSTTWQTLISGLSTDGTHYYALFFASDDTNSGDYHTYLFDLYYNTTNSQWNLKIYGPEGLVKEITGVNTSSTSPTTVTVGNLDVNVYVDTGGTPNKLMAEVDNIKTIYGPAALLAAWKGLP